MKKLSNVQYLMTVVDPAALDEDGAEVAFVGRSNVGKSSVLNAVCKHKRLAFTSQVPGKTRTINVFTVGGRRDRRLVDLPGYGYAVGPATERDAWPAMIEGYLTIRPALRRVYVIIDAKVGPTKLDQQMVDWINARSLPYAIVANKADKVASGIQTERRAAVAAALGVYIDGLFWVSAERGAGIDDLADDIASELEV